MTFHDPFQNDASRSVFRTRTVRIPLLALIILGMSTFGIGQNKTIGGGGTGSDGTGTAGKGMTGTSNQGTNSGPADMSTLQATLGLTGTTENGVMKFEFVRSDLSPTWKGQSADPALLTHGFFNFWNVTSTSGGTSGTGTSGTATTGTTSFNQSNFPTVMTAEIPLQETEVTPFMKAVANSQSGIMVAAEHNHFLMESPRLVFVHLEGAGGGNDMATVVASALQQAGVKVSDPQTSQTVAGLDTTTIQGTLGGTGEVLSSSVFEIEVPRSETFTDCTSVSSFFLLSSGTGGSGTGGMGGGTGGTSGSGGSGQTGGTPTTTGGSFSPAFTAVAGCLTSGLVIASGSTTGAATATSTGVQPPPQFAAFSDVTIQAASSTGGNAVVVGELALLSTEIQPTINSLVQNGFDISAVHNHSVNISPPLYFVHFAATGDALTLVQQIRTAISANRTAAGQ